MDRTVEDVLRFLQSAIAEEGQGRTPPDIAWDITDLMGLPTIDALQKQYPLLGEIFNASADLEVIEKVGYKPVDILWGRIKRLTGEQKLQIKV